MDAQKLRIEKFKNIQVVNFPADIDLNIESTDKHVEVIIYYIDKVEDIRKFVRLANESNLPEHNRTILVYQKGRKDEVNRDSIIRPFKTKEIAGFQMKAPMLCSISKELSAFVLAKVV